MKQGEMFSDLALEQQYDNMVKALNMKKQTAVEWLFRKLWDEPKDKLTWYALLKLAKEMDKEQKLEVSKAGCFSTFEFEQYYNETYNNDAKRKS
jgi:tRNA nucleotidyltransferase/poly(A) polymerase